MLLIRIALILLLLLHTSALASPLEVAYVFRVIDGDSILVEIGGAKREVRYIGINAPEYGEPCGKEATTANAELVSKQQVFLMRDVRDTDKYGRLLRYVYVKDRLINAALVERGFAVARRYEPDTQHAKQFAALEAEARLAKRGCHALAH
jgi:micrococcal nuclease